MINRIAIVLLLGSLVVSLKFALTPKAKISFEEILDAREVIKVKVKKQEAKRAIASLSKSNNDARTGGIFAREIEKENFTQFSDDPVSELSEDAGAVSSGTENSFTGFNSSYAPARHSPPSDTEANKPAKSPMAKAGQNGTRGGVVNGSFARGITNLPPEDEKPSEASDAGSSLPGGSFNGPAPVCSADVGSGSYNSLINLSLTCSTAASISYCISESGCCNPSSGVAYLAPFSVGNEAKTYCVSFSGTDADGETSATVEHTYTFNPHIPNIQVATTKTIYQTTQLLAMTSFTSSDFGTNFMSAGILNLKGNDPVTNGLTTCTDIVEGSGALSPLTVMPLTDVSGYSPSQQLNVTMSTLTMVYGQNFITTYLQNTEFLETYSCSTSTIVLEDFPYFESNPSNGVLNGSVLEFSGGFTAVGFFEQAEPLLYRGPAGSSAENQASQELRSGLTSIFH